MAGNSQGFALVVVIVIMLLISFLAGQLILNVRTELRVAYNDKSFAAGLGLAQAGLNMGLFRLLDRPVEYIDEDYEMFIQGYEYDSFLKTGHFSYTVVNESGKMDLNKLNESFFRLFLEYWEIDSEDQDIIYDSLLDWRDSDDLHRLNGAETETYEQLENPYVPRNGKIREPSELFLVHGTSALAGLFKATDFFTVHNNTGRINFNSLTPMMLDFLTEGDPERIEAYREAQELYGVLTREQARQILGDERFSQCSAALTYASGSNKFYSIITKGEAGIDKDTADETKNKTAAVEVRVLFELRGSNVHYSSWEEGLS